MTPGAGIPTQKPSDDPFAAFAPKVRPPESDPFAQFAATGRQPVFDSAAAQLTHIDTDVAPQDEPHVEQPGASTIKAAHDLLTPQPLDLTHRGTSRSWGDEIPESNETIPRDIRLQHARPSDEQMRQDAIDRQHPTGVAARLADLQQQLKRPNAKDEQALVDKVFGKNEAPGYVAPQGSTADRAIDNYVKPVARGAVGAAQMVDAAVEHPIETAAGMVMAPIQSGGTAVQYALQKAAEHIGPENAKRLGEMVEMGKPVTGHDAAWAAAQLAALGLAGPIGKAVGSAVMPLLPRALRVAEGADLVMGETGASLASRGAAETVSRPAAIIGHAAASVPIGAAYNENDPIAGAVGMGLVGGGLAGITGAEATGSPERTARDVEAVRARMVPDDGANLAGHPHRLVESGLPKPSVRATVETRQTDPFADFAPESIDETLAKHRAANPVRESSNSNANAFQEKAAETLFGKRYPEGTGNGKGPELGPEDQARADAVAAGRIATAPADAPAPSPEQPEPDRPIAERLAAARAARQQVQPDATPSEPPQQQPSSETLSVRTPAGTLRSNLADVHQDDLVVELARLHDANAEDGNIAVPTRIPDDNFHTFSDGRPYVGMKGAAINASGRIAARNKTIEKIEAELQRRGIGDYGVSELLMQHHEKTLADAESADERAGMQDEGDSEGVGFHVLPDGRVYEKGTRGHYDQAQADLFANREPLSPEAKTGAIEEAKLAFGGPVKHGVVAEAVRKLHAAGLPVSTDRVAGLAPSKAKQTWVDLRGHMLLRHGSVDPSKLSSLMSVFRNPNHEVFHVILLDASGKILSHVAESAGALNWSTFAHPAHVVARAKRLGAVNAIIVHNHPSGDPTPSSDDRAVTNAIGSHLQQSGIHLDGHLVIDHHTASWIAPTGTPGQLSTSPVAWDSAVEPTWTTGKDPGYPVITSPADAARVVVASTDPKAPLLTVLYMDAQNRLVAVEPRSVTSMNTIGKWLGPQIRAHAASVVVLALPESDARHLVLAPEEWSSHVVDVLGTEPGPNGQTGITSHAQDGTFKSGYGRDADANAKPHRLFERGDSYAANSGGRNSHDEAGRVSESKRVAEETPGEKTTGIKNAASAADRDALGMGERAKPEPRTQDEMYEAGKTAADADPTALPHLLDELRADPEKIVGTKVEAGLLLKHRVDLDNKLKDLIARKDEAVAEKDANAEHVTRLQLAEHREAIKEFVKLAERTGTATGRALAARRMMSKLDYSLSNMEAMSEAAKGSALTDDELTKIKALHDELTVKLAEAQKDVASARERAAEAEADLHHAELRAEAAGPLRERVAKRLETVAEAAKRRIKARGLRAQAGLDPEDLADHAILGAIEIARGVSRFADWSDKMLDEYGEYLKPHLREIFDASNEKLNAELQSTKATDTAKTKAQKPPRDIRQKMLDRLDDGIDSLGELRPYLRQLALDHIRSGITEREPLLDQLHTDLTQIGLDITKREVRDALSGYGEFVPLDKSADKVRLREIQAESQKLAQLDALKKGEAPLASGFERPEMNDETRRLAQQVNAAKKAAGIGGMDDETRLKSALSSAKTRTRNAIKDLQTEIDTGHRIVAGKSVLISDPELDALKTQLAELRKVEADVFQKEGLTDEQRLHLAIAAAKRNAETWTVRLGRAHSGTFEAGRKAAPLSSPELDALRAQAKAARQEYNELKGLDPAQRVLADERANQQYRAMLARREADLLGRIAREDFGPRPVKPGMVQDRETMQRKAEVEMIKQRYNELNHQYEKAHRSGFEKAADRWTAFVRMGVLSWPTVLGKLTSVALTRVVTTPVTDLVAMGVSKALPGLAKGAPRYGTMSIRTALRAEAAAQSAMWVDGLKQAGQLLRNNRSRLELLHGKEKLPPHWSDYMGRLHAALKEPIKEAEYARSLHRRTEAAMLNGEDVTSPFVQLRLSTEAYLDAERAVSMNHNVITDAWNNAIRRLNQKEKASGKPSPLGIFLSTIARTEMPVVKAPTNVVLEASEIIAGLPLGAARAAWAYAHGIEDLEPIERDSIIRMIAKGSIGLAIMSLYFYKHDHVEFGGFYQPGEKRKTSDVPAGAVRVAGKTIPPSLIHNPYFAAGQFAASIARIAPQRIRKHGKERQGYGNALAAATFGLLDETPILGSLVDELRDIKDPARRNEFVAKRAASLAVPGVIQWTAKEHDNSTPRKPLGLKEHLEYNVPGLRENVPTAKARARRAILMRQLAR